MHVLGTAGHVDHGKSTLVRALTGIDPDRLAEEKRRGLTIDLGFAWLRLPSGREVGIVDVPGHERFIKNMLAGVGAINANLFVVAANEGWKPQSQEHLDILDLLGVSSGIVVVTKSDLVDQDELELVQEMIRERLQGTSLHQAPMMAVSAETGEGMEELLRAIDALLQAAAPAEDRDRPRLWIDRVFTIKGAGTVVTGTLTGGALHKGQEVRILPDGEKARVRSIQSHRKELAALEPGNRAAVNLSGLEQEELKRGDLLTRPGAWLTTDRILASIKFLPGLGHKPTEKGAFKLYVGSLELDAIIRFLEEPPEAGQTGMVSIRLDRPTVFDFKDRFILRDSGRRQTLGGGVVLEAHPSAQKHQGERLLAGARARVSAASRTEYFQVLLEEQGYLSQAEVVSKTGLSLDQAKKVEAVWVGDYAASSKTFQALRDELIAKVRAHHLARPLDAGMPLTQLRIESGVNTTFLDAVVGELVRSGALAASADSVHDPGFSPKVQSPERLKLLESLKRAGASVPSAAELGRTFGSDLLRALVRTGEIVTVGPDLAYPAEWISEVKETIKRKVGETGPFTVAQFRDLIGASRKYAVPLLEYLDQQGFTRRTGDLRTLGPKAE